MNPGDRTVLFIYALVSILAAKLYFISSLGWGYPVTLFSRAISQPYARETLYALLFIYILAGLRLAWVALKPANRRAVVHEGALGQIRIALTAIESLVEKVVSKFSGVREVKSRVVAVPRGVGINVKVSFTPDTNIPQISEAIQNSVREQVLEITGVAVSDVRIVVENISAQKPRVE